MKLSNHSCQKICVKRLSNVEFYSVADDSDQRNLLAEFFF